MIAENIAAVRMPGDDAGDEERADGRFGHHPVEDEDETGRDENAERARRGERARRQARMVLVAPHLGHHDRPHGRHGCDARAGHRAERAAGDHRRDRHAARHLADPGADAVIEIRREAHVEDELSHQDEERNGDEDEAASLVPWDEQRVGQRRAGSFQDPEADGGPGHRHRNSDGDSEDEEHEHRDDADETGEREAHDAASSPGCPVTRGRHGTRDVSAVQRAGRGWPVGLHARGVREHPRDHHQRADRQEAHERPQRHVEILTGLPRLDHEGHEARSPARPSTRRR